MTRNRRVGFGRAPVIGWTAGSLPLPAKWHKLEMNEAGDIEFKLSERVSQAGYHFDTGDPDNAIWVCEDDGQCPPSRTSHGQIENIRCTGDSVTVTNRCETPVTLRYQLNVLDRQNRPSPIDPIIENVPRI